MVIAIFQAKERLQIFRQLPMNLGRVRIDLCRFKARVILINKGSGKPIDHPSSFRSISLLDGTEKILECLRFNYMRLCISARLSTN